MKKRYLCMAAIIFLMNTLTGCALKNENMEAIYKEFLDNGDVGSLQWSWVLEPGQYEDIRFVNDNMVAVQNGSDKWGVWDLEKEILVTSCKYNNIPNDAARYYSEGYAAVQKDGKWGFVDEAGQCVIPCQYDEVVNRRFWMQSRLCCMPIRTAVDSSTRRQQTIRTVH
mgnify:CR=1 FL=1